MSLTVTDLFCGAGGSGLGAHAAGYRLVMAANHWAKAIETHAANFPETEHDCADISQVDPRRYPTTDVLWASPECTNHSQAKGKRRALANQPDMFGETLPDEAAERSRATMWDVPRFAERHPYRAIIVENVVEASKWALFPAWLHAMSLLGYEHQIVSLNSMHAAAITAPRAPQSRDRLYVVFHRFGQPRPDVTPRPDAFCPQCGRDVSAIQAWKNGNTVGKYRAQYIYACTGCGATVEPGWLPASSAIDWALLGRRIGDRDKPLAPKTLARIAAGIARYWRPFSLEAAGHTFERRPGVRTWPIDEPFTTLHGSLSKALAVPLEGRDGKHAQPTWLPGRTQTTRHETALVVPSGGTWNEDARPVDDPYRSFTTTEAYGVLTPFIAELRGGSSDARPTTDPLCTVTAGGNHHALVAPYYSGSGYAQSVDQPIGTLTTRDRYALVMRNNGGGAEMSTPAFEPIRTLTTTGHQSLITPGDVKAAEALVDDCLFRMLEPHEVAAGMAFPADYKWAGKRRARVKMMGNAVTPPAARDLMCAAVESLGGAA